MGYEDDMNEYYEYTVHKKQNQPYLKLHDDNLICCGNIKIGRIIWEYLEQVTQVSHNK